MLATVAYLMDEVRSGSSLKPDRFLALNILTSPATAAA
jgi:hypothetical protein